jgi:hypothetical protein
MKGSTEPSPSVSIPCFLMSAILMSANSDRCHCDEHYCAQYHFGECQHKSVLLLLLICRGAI